MSGTGEPGRLPRAIVSLTVRCLPAGTARTRYRQELVAELHGRSYRRQLTAAISVLVHCGALRRAVAPMNALDGARTGYRKPLLCYVHHRLRLFTNPDGVSYRRCIRCGEDHYDGRGDNNLNGNVISAIVGASPGM